MVSLVYLVYLVYFVCFVYLVYFVMPPSAAVTGKWELGIGTF